MIFEESPSDFLLWPDVRQRCCRATMKRKPRAQQDPHPLAMTIFGGFAAAFLGMFYWLFGIGEKAFQFSASVALFYTASVLITLAFAALVWGVVRLFRGLQRTREAISTETVVFLCFFLALIVVAAWVLHQAGAVG